MNFYWLNYVTGCIWILNGVLHIHNIFGPAMFLLGAGYLLLGKTQSYTHAH